MICIIARPSSVPPDARSLITSMLEADGSAPSASSAAAPPRSLKLSEITPTLMPLPLTLNPLSSKGLLHLCRGGAVGTDAGVGDRRRGSRRWICQARRSGRRKCRCQGVDGNARGRRGDACSRY